MKQINKIQTYRIHLEKYVKNLEVGKLLSWYCFNASKGQASLNKTTHTIPPPFLIFTFSVTSSQTTKDEVFIEVGKFRQTSRVCRTFVTNIFPRKNTRLKTANQRQLAQGKHQSPVIYFSSHNALGIEINHSAFHLTRDG